MAKKKNGKKKATAMAVPADAAKAKGLVADVATSYSDSQVVRELIETNGKKSPDSNHQLLFVSKKEGELSRDTVKAVCALRNRSWFQADIRFINTVGKFDAKVIKMLVNRAGEVARGENRNVLCMTTNGKEFKLAKVAKAAGFKAALKFKNPKTGSLVTVWLRSAKS